MIEIATGFAGVESAGFKFWPCIEALSRDPDDPFSPRYESAMFDYGGVAPGASDLYPVGITAAQAEAMNFRMRRIRLAGAINEAFYRHQGMASGAIFSDATERDLDAFPGINFIQRFANPQIALQVGFVMQNSSAGVSYGGVRLDNGSAWPVAVQRWIGPNFGLIPFNPVADEPWPGWTVVNYTELPPAVYFAGGLEWPLFRLEWHRTGISLATGGSTEVTYSTYPWNEFSGDPVGTRRCFRYDTGRRAVLFDWVEVPIYLFVHATSDLGSPPVYSPIIEPDDPEVVLPADVRIEAVEWFTHGGIYDPDTGEPV